MTATDDTTQRIRSLLEPHDYRIKDVQGWYGSEFDVAHDGSYIDHPMFEDESATVRWGLTHFLNDKAQTGARIADLAHVDIEHCVGGWRVSSLNGAEQKHVPFDGTYYETSDEAIATLWLRAHDLPDPRKEVTA